MGPTRYTKFKYLSLGAHSPNFSDTRNQKPVAGFLRFTRKILKYSCSNYSLFLFLFLFVFNFMLSRKPGAGDLWNCGPSPLSHNMWRFDRTLTQARIYHALSRVNLDSIAWGDWQMAIIFFFNHVSSMRMTIFYSFTGVYGWSDLYTSVLIY